MTAIFSKTKDALQYIKNSFYYKKITNNKNIIIASLILAIICTMIAYPGIWYSDSYTRVQFTDAIIKSIKDTFTNNINSTALMCWLTVIPSFFMAICKLVTGNIATYTILQSFMFFLVTFLLIKRMKTFLYKFQYVLFALSPLIFCVTGIVAFLLMLDYVKIKKNKLDKVIEILLLTLFSFIIFGYRANAFTIIPVLIIYIFTIKTETTKKFLVTGALILGIIFLNLFNLVFNIKILSSESAGFVWEIIRVIQNMEPEKREKYENYLDEICGEGRN